jgi:hypothetical protein
MANKLFLKFLNNATLRERLAFRWKNHFRRSDRHLPVIQIGVGGFSSAGKTVLIDAMFSLFANNLSPGYIPRTFKGGLYKVVDKFEGVFTQYTELRVGVSDTFHMTNETTDLGDWKENTHCGKLSFCGREVILLIRNLPGEMFRVFFEKPPSNLKSIKVQLEEFINAHAEYKHIYKDLYRFNLPGKKNNQVRHIKAKIIEIRDKFIAECRNNNVPNETIDSVSTNFFACLFYLSSDYNVFCVRSSNSLSERERRVNNAGINFDSENPESDKNYVLCFTQIDLILNGKELPSKAATEAINKEGQTSSGDLIEKKKRTWGAVNNQNNQEEGRVFESADLLKYWKSMSLLYADLHFNAGLFFNKEEWRKLKNRNIGSNAKSKWFIASVAYNYSQQRFLSFKNQNSEEKEEIWNIENNNERTPVGVLELMLYILLSSKHKMYMKNSTLELPEEIEYTFVNEKIKQF